MDLSIKTAIKPIYIIIAEDPTEKSGVSYYVSESIIRNGSFIEMKGYSIIKSFAEKIKKQNNDVKNNGKLINVEIPNTRIISITNVSYRQKK